MGNAALAGIIIASVVVSVFFIMQINSASPDRWHDEREARTRGHFHQDDDASTPSNTIITIVMFAGISLGFVFEHFFVPVDHTWHRQAFADQQALVVLCVIVALSYGLRWFQKTPADERDRYFTQIGMVVTMLSLAADKQYWTYSVYLNATKDPFLKVWRTTYALIEFIAIFGIYIGLLLMIYPWSQRWLGSRLWWMPWAIVPAIWMIAFKFSGQW